MGRTIQINGFPSDVSAEMIKQFLEGVTGIRSVYALKVRGRMVKQPKSRVFAIVQFESSKFAEEISNLAHRLELWYGRSYLKVKDLEHDIVLKPRTAIFSFEDRILHFGCLVSADKFSILWTGLNVSVKFGSGMKKLYFFLSSYGVDYKLELCYENIWQIQLRKPGGDIQFLLFQLQGAPLIFEKPAKSSDHIYEDPLLNYFRDAPDDQWIRTTDFTRSSNIGQSSALCLELSSSTKLKNMKDYFVYYQELEGKFVLEEGASFSCNLDLVPIVGPCRQIGLPYRILFKINLLVQNGYLVGPTLNDEFFGLVNPCSSIPMRYIEHALEKLSYLKECCFEPAKWLLEQFSKYGKTEKVPMSPAIELDSGLVYVNKIQVTPSRVYFFGPEVNVSNRVLRRYSEYIDNFIRISFIDEDSEKMRSIDLSMRNSADNKKHTGIYERILSTLKNGVVIGDKKFDFLAFSASQLRDNSAWMFARAPEGFSAADIRRWMGDFREIRNVAKYSARLGQSFGSSTETLDVPRSQVEDLPDIEVTTNDITYIFSDGIGKISAQFARKVAKKCDSKGKTPSAFQIRYGGYKGVVAIDPTSIFDLSLRRSMCKFESDNTKLDVLSWSKYQPCYLNRQLINLLSTLGVSDHVFEIKQREAVTQLDSILTDPERALEALEVMAPGENTKVLREMLHCGYMPNSEPFLSMMLQTFRASKLLDLRKKTRIFVQKGRTMLGCMDETRTLEYGQVFVQVSSIQDRQFNNNRLFIYGESELDQRRCIMVGKVVVAKNPCLHPGDVRVLQAVNVPALHHMVDCVVFPQKGKRPHPNECSGSDLDGDLYFVSWDEGLIPPRQIPPMDYRPAPSVTLDHDVTIEEVEEYFTKYMLNDSLGIISNAHTVFADKDYLKAESENCIELARLFSIAVDFPKTGVPAEIPPNLRPKEFPDFMEKLDKPTYESKRVIGKLFREIKDVTPDASSIQSFSKRVAEKAYDPDMEIDGFECYLSDAYYYKSTYDFKLGNLMDHYGIKTEGEIISGSIMKLAKTFNRHRDAEAIGLAVRSLKKEVRGWFEENNKEHIDDPDAKASAWYYVTYHSDYWGCYSEELKRPHFLSFPWCVHDKLISIKKRRNAARKAELAALQRRMEKFRFR